MAMTHELKTWDAVFDALVDGRKTFELRRDDRGFQVGDTLRLREWAPERAAYTGRELSVVVDYLLRAGLFPGLEPGFVIMGFALVRCAR